MSIGSAATFGTPEEELMLLCSRTRFSQEVEARVCRILKGPVDWDFVKDSAGRNGIAPLVTWNLLNRFRTEISGEIAREFSDYLSVHTRKNLFLTRKLIELEAMLTGNGVEMLPFKGSTLAQRAYGNLALRQYVDLDILVKPKDFDRAVTLLSAASFKTVGPSPARVRGPFGVDRRKDVGLVSEDGEVRVELHWKLSGSHFAMPFEIDELWGRLVEVEVGGTKLNALPFEDLFVYLCLHGSRHRWEKFSWICDLNELLRSREEEQGALDPGHVLSHASRYGCGKVTEFGLFLVERYFGLATKGPQVERIMSDRGFRRIAEELDRRVFKESEGAGAVGDWYFYHLSLKERRFDRLKLHIFYLLWYLRLAFRPNALDERVFRLPKIFYPLYYLLRPVRLAVNYLKPRAGRSGS